MLILTRRPGEAFQISNDITITVLSVNGKQIKLGIQAPPDTPIVRSELLTERASRTRPTPR